MKFKVACVPPGGGEQDCIIEVNADVLPNAGDYITLVSTKTEGTEDFIVKRRWWNLNETSKDSQYEAEIWVEAEYALNSTSSDDHREVCSKFEKETGVLLKFKTSMY